jgi:hypothetical protein
MRHKNLESYFLTQDIVLSDEGLDKIVEAVLADQAEQSDERREYTVLMTPQEIEKTRQGQLEIARYIQNGGERG